MKKQLKILMIATGLLLIAFGGLFLYMNKSGYLAVYDRLTGMDNSTKIGWITDIHADRFKRKTVDGGTIYPKQYMEYLPKVFDAMRNRGIDTVIATGDNTNSGDDNYSNDIARIAKEKHMHVIWVTGNHDNDKTMATLGVTGSKYYLTDYGNTRIVVLDDAKVTRETGDYLGGIDQQQLDWLQGVLKTDKQVIIAMHIPIFISNLDQIRYMTGGNFPNEGNPLDRYAELEKILHENGNVKIVLSGHLHVPWQKEYDGINYYGEAALTREDYKGAYAEIDLKNNSVNYLFAK